MNSICDEVIAPAQDLDPEIAEAAAAAAVSIASELGVTGVMAAELFEVPGSPPASTSTSWRCARTTPVTGLRTAR